MSRLKEDMFKLISRHKRIRPCQIREDYVWLSRTRVHQVLKELLNEGKIIKSGRFPKIYYHAVRK